MRIELCHQDLSTGLFKQATLFFGTTDVLSTVSYDPTPVPINAWAEIRTMSPDWFDGTLSQDFVVKRISDQNYSFFYRSYNINSITGFFTVHHAPGDVFTYVGLYRGATRPTNGFYPVVRPSVSASMIDPDFSGDTVLCAKYSKYPARPL
jgi:hypothetical protein